MRVSDTSEVLTVLSVLMEQLFQQGTKNESKPTRKLRNYVRPSKRKYNGPQHSVTGWARVVTLL